jgi:hypothetical protein
MIMGLLSISFIRIFPLKELLHLKPFKEFLVIYSTWRKVMLSGRNTLRLMGGNLREMIRSLTHLMKIGKHSRKL